VAQTDLGARVYSLNFATIPYSLEVLAIWPRVRPLFAYAGLALSSCMRHMNGKGGYMVLYNTCAQQSTLANPHGHVCFRFPVVRARLSQRRNAKKPVQADSCCTLALAFLFLLSPLPTPRI
jgi:hypothetical protein